MTYWRVAGDLIAAEIEVVSPDFGHLEQTVTAARRQLEAADITQVPRAVVADSGYWHTEPDATLGRRRRCGVDSARVGAFSAR